MAFIAIGGTLVAGLFGVLHDQITYTISAEYFTRMKFDQFGMLESPLPERWKVAWIGFLGTWWVGLIGAWFLARLSIPRMQHPYRHVARSLGIILAITAAAGCLGYFTGPALFEERAGWSEAMDSMEITDRPAFLRVAGIHLAGYLGAAMGFLAVLILTARREKRSD